MNHLLVVLYAEARYLRVSGLWHYSPWRERLLEVLRCITVLERIQRN